VLNVGEASDGVPAPGEELLFSGPDPAAGVDPDARFDAIVAALEAAILERDFHDAATDFCRAHCSIFEDPAETGGEMKLAYTPIFEQYTALVEGRIMESLSRGVPGKPVDEEELAALLEARGGELAGDVFDVLLAMGDFEEFVALMSSYRQQAEFEREEEGERGGEEGEESAGAGAAAAAASTSPAPSPSKRSLPSYVGLAPTVISLERRVEGLSLGGGGGAGAGAGGP
jgi:hypothetical protein